MITISDMTKLKDEIITSLSGELNKNIIQLIESTLISILQHYDIKTKDDVNISETALYHEMDLFLGRMEYKNCSPGTYNQYKNTLKSMIDYLQKPVKAITDTDIINFLNDYETVRKISKRTKDGKRRIISSFFSFLLNNGFLPNGNPMARIEPIKYTMKVRQALTPREVEKLRIACRDNLRDNTVLELFLATGCRVSEIEQMRLENFNFEEGSIKVLGKEDKERIVFLGARALEFLDNYLDGRRTGPVILSHRAPYQGLKKNSLENIIRKIAEQANLDKQVFPHLLRHTFATRSLNKGMPLSELCDLMGHASMDTTRIYAKNSRQKLKYDYDMYAVA